MIDGALGAVGGVEEFLVSWVFSVEAFAFGLDRLLVFFVRPERVGETLFPLLVQLIDAQD